MINCPECGEQAPEGAKYCERCGQGLTAASAAPPPASASRPAPLAPGAVLKGGFEIVAVLDGTSIENRYRARRVIDGKEATFVLRERTAPQPSAETEEEFHPEPAPEPPMPENDPAGPRAKTAELKPRGAGEQTAAAPAGAATSAEAAPSAVEPASAEGSVAEIPSPEVSQAPSAATEGAAGDGSVSAARAAADAGAQVPARNGGAPEAEKEPGVVPAPGVQDDVGEVFGRVLALSMTLTHPAFQRAKEGFADAGRVYLVYTDEALSPVVRGTGKIAEPDAISAAVQVCQAISFIHRRGLRLNDICPQSVAVAKDGRIKMTGLDYVSNDNELQADPIFNDGYSAPEIYRGKKTDKRADVFSAAALLYTWLTGERLESESWREEAGPIRFYPPHVISPDLEQAILRALLFDPKDRWSTIDEFKAELTRLLGKVRVRAIGMTDVGMVREHNEDAVMSVEYVRDSLVEPAQNGLYAVCDGMGGAEAGEVAAAIAVATIRDYVEKRIAGAEAADPSKLMIAALEEANTKILEYQAAHPESRGMGSTGVTALVTGANATVAWVGDSRAYALEGGVLRQVTKDHSLVQRLIEIGHITPEEARHHEHKNVITRSLGARQSGPAGAEAVTLKLKRGDKMLLCSDGLTTHVEDPDVADIMRRHGDPYDIARELIAAANAGGGTDNISVVVIFAS